MFQLDSALVAVINRGVDLCLASIHTPDSIEARLEMLTAMRLLAEEYFDGSDKELKYLTHINVMIADLEIKKQFNQ